MPAQALSQALVAYAEIRTILPKKVLFINNILMNILSSTILEYKDIDFYCSFSGGNLSTGSEPKRLTEGNDNGAT